jgi:tRNA threonylcarbamoyladenosine biosynthesis protein TsaB
LVLITLGIDTCEARGSIAVRKNGVLASVQEHETAEDFSSWLLPAVEKCLREAGAKLDSVDVFGVATGPGSFTGLRVGITAVKAWGELYGKPLVGVSRLEVMVRTIGAKAEYVAASFDAQRGQIFGGLFRARPDGDWERVEQEMVIAADEFVTWVGERAGEETVQWATLDPGLLQSAPGWKKRAERGESPVVCRKGLAAGVAELSEELARRQEASDALHLDANYVRRSEAEIFWKDPGSHGR